MVCFKYLPLHHLQQFQGDGNEIVVVINSSTPELYTLLLLGYQKYNCFIQILLLAELYLLYIIPEEPIEIPDCDHLYHSFH